MSDTCPSCGMNVQQMALDLQLAQNEIVRQRRVENALRMKMKRDVEDDPITVDVKEVGAYWKLKIRPKSRVPSDGKRADVIKKALKHNSVETLKRAIDGAATDDWVMGRHPQTSKWNKSSLKNDVQHIIGDETLIEKFVGLAEDDSTPPIEKVLDRLDGVTETSPGQWSALCPAHMDSQTSLTISQGEKGVLVNCFTGCEFKDIVKALGMRAEELFGETNQELMVKAVEPDPLPSEQQIEQWMINLVDNRAVFNRIQELRGWKIGSFLNRLRIGFDGERITIPQYDREGELCNVIRYKPGGRPKTLPVRGRSRVLYPFPSTKRSDEVYIFEGEADAILGVQMFPNATVTSIPGAAAWKDEWKKYFRPGQRVNLVFDCDEPGRTAAEKVKESLSGVVKDVQIVDLAPDRTDGYDFTDFTLEGRKLDELVESVY